MRNLAEILIFIVLFSCGTQKKIDTNSDNSLANSQAEYFDDFLKTFSSDKDFQLSRIEFPLSDCKYIGQYAMPCTKIQKEDWKHLVLSDSTKFKVMFYEESDDSEFNMDKYERILGKVSSNDTDCLYYHFFLDKNRWKMTQITKCTD